MCGRYTYFGPLEIIKESVQINVIDKEPDPNYNIAPTQYVPAVLRQADQTYLKYLHWGLIPFWAKDPSIGARMINARVETLAEKPSFKNAFKKRRCLIPANGYYEWTGTKGDKQPYFITATDGKPFCFAGLWETWKGMGDESADILSCAIITMDAGAQIAHIHNRMPVTLRAENYRKWLDPDLQDSDKLSEFLRMGTVREFAFYPVSKNVNLIKNNNPELIKAIVL